MSVEILTDDERRLVSDNPETGFLADFEEWAAKKTDAPGYTLQAAGLMALSLAAGDTVVLPNFFGSTVYMNLYILIVGPSTTLRKSTVLGMVKDILPRNLQNGQDYIVTLDDVSPQAFNKVAGAQGKVMGPILLSVDEVAGLFQTVRKTNSYMAGFDSTLLRAYDHSPIYVSRTESEVVAPRGAFINIFAASTPGPLMDVLEASDVSSGLLPRFLIFDATDADRGDRETLMARLAAQDEWEEGAENLQKLLSEIAFGRAMGIPIGEDEYGGALYTVTEVGLSMEALERLDKIDDKWSEEAGRDTAEWAAIKGRGFWHIVKLSGLFALSRAGREAQVELIDVLRASWLVETTIADLVTMQDNLGSNSLERRINEVSELLALAGRGGMAQSGIARRLKLSARELAELRMTMEVRKLMDYDKDSDKWRRMA